MAYKSFWEIDQAGFPRLMLEGKKVVAPEPLPLSGNEQARRRDAVREAAREFEPLSDQDVRERLKGVTNRALSEVEVSSFTEDIASQVLDDLVDLLDQNLRGVKRRRRRVRIQAPRGYVRKALNDRTDLELVELGDRLRGRGWTTAQIQDHYARHIMAERVIKVVPSTSETK